METTFSIGMLVEGEQAGVDLMWFNTELQCFPHKGMEFEHPAFDGTSAVQSVTYNLEEGTLYVWLGDIHYGSREEREAAIGYFKDAGWKPPHETR